MKTTKDAIRQNMNELHFTKALSLLADVKEDERDAEYWYESGICHSSIYAARQAKQDFLKALASNPSPRLASKIRLRLVHLYTQSGEIEQAEKTYAELKHNRENGPMAECLLYGALLYYEKGSLDQALDLALKLAKSDDPDLGKLRCEAWTLAGDLYSAKDDFDKALKCYGQALRLLDFLPPNWRPLRKALILNNLADIYEQFEHWPEAAGVYGQAWKSIQEIEDEEIYDLNGYKLEILLSMANFYALQDALEQAGSILKKAVPLAEAMEMPMILYWKSRINYIGGLCELYAENPKLDPFDKLFEAWKLQEKFLSLSVASSREYLGRTAYYAAYCYNEKKAEGVSQKYLYAQALRLFGQCFFKDPKFFLFSIASVENELGTLEQRDSPVRARDLYAQSAQGFKSYLRRWPDDMLAQTSLLAVLLNLIAVLDDRQIEEYGRQILDLFEKTLIAVRHDPEARLQAEEALGRLLDDDRLYKHFASRLEEMHGLLFSIEH